MSESDQHPDTRVLRPAGPLRHIAPAYDPQGNATADFMMLIPRLSQRGQGFADQAAQRLCAVCATFDGQVLFADLNYRTGAVWVSVRARPGICAEVARAIRRDLPQAVTVGGQVDPVGELVVLRQASRWRRWLSRIPRLGGRLRALSPPDNDVR